MSTFPKVLLIFSILLFGTIGVIAFFKGGKEASVKGAISAVSPMEIKLSKEVQIVAPAPSQTTTKPSPAHPEPHRKPQHPAKERVAAFSDGLPDANRIEELFNKEGPKLPIVETIVYKSRVPWQKGRPAWLSDYAGYYKTSRHFIARSLNGKPDYLKQDLFEGDQFNVLRKDKNFQFYLLVDLSRCRMWFYYDDLDTKERVLLKTYRVGLGRVDSAKASGLLTPVGKYSLGSRIAIYSSGVKGIYQGEKIEMMRVFGTRWIPFEKEVANCSAPAKGFGIHGVPWNLTAKGERVEDRSSIEKYQSDGCIRMASEDVEELFAIIVTKPTTIELVKEFVTK